jgi:hypothetical protein
MTSKVRSIQRARDQHEAKGAEIATTVGALFSSSNALQKLVNEALPARQAFAVAKIAKAVGAELEACNETRLRLCEQYGKLNEDKTGYDFASSKREAFDKEWGELTAVPVTIRGEQIKVDSLRTVSISAADLLALSWLIVE